MTHVFPRPADLLRDSPRIAILAALLLVVLTPASRPAADPDVFFHLRMGEWILGHGGFPHEDPFSRTDLEPHRPGTAYSWLFEIALAGAYRAARFTGVMILTMALGLAVALVLLGLVIGWPRAPGRTTAVLALAFLALWPMMTPRPWLVSMLFFGIELGLLGRVRNRGNARRLLLLVPLFVVWANLHIQFTHGLLLLGLFFLDRLGSWRGKDMGLLIATGCACALATLANPYGPGVWRVVFQYVTQGAVSAGIAEISPPDFRSVPEWAPLVLAGWTAWSLARRRKDRGYGMLLMAVGLALYLHSRRDMWFLVFSAAAVLAGPGVGPPASIPAASPFPGRIWAPGILLSGVLLVVAGHGHGFRNRWHEAWMREHYPVAATAFVKRELWKPAGGTALVFSGPLYNSFNWGSYLIWALPELPVSIDGRTNVHSRETILRHWATWDGRPGWETDPYLTTANLVLLERTAPLAALLRSDPRFLEVYEDSTGAPGAIVFARIAGE